MVSNAYPGENLNLIKLVGALLPIIRKQLWLPSFEVFTIGDVMATKT
jgi:hypothetical protein